MRTQSNNKNILTNNEILKSAVSEYLTSDDPNKRCQAGRVIVTECQPKNGECDISMIDPLIASLEKSEFESKKNDSICDARILSLLGLLYRVKLNFTKAIHYLEQASIMDEAHALYIRGCIYHKGLSGEVDLNKSIECYERAAKLNHAASMNALAGIFHTQECNRRGSSNHSDQEIAELFYTAVQLGDSSAKENFNNHMRCVPYMCGSFSQNLSKNSVTLSKHKNTIEYTQSVHACIAISLWDESYVTETFKLQLPNSFLNLNVNTREQLLNLIERKISRIYYNHTKQYNEIFEDSPFDAEVLKRNFDKNKNQLIQNCTDKICECLDVLNLNIVNGFRFFSKGLKDQTIAWLMTVNRMKKNKNNQHLTPPKPIVKQIASLAIPENEPNKCINEYMSNQLSKFNKK